MPSQSIAKPEQPKQYASRAPGLRRLIHRVLPIHVYAPLRAELRLAWLRARSRSTAGALRGHRNLLLNVGAGSQGKPGWVNIDVAAHPSVTCVYDCRRNLPLDDNSVRGIFCEHFFEHLDYLEEAPVFLRECHRVMQPGAILRIIVPDLELYLRAYVEPGWDAISRVRGLGPGRTDPYMGVRYETKMEIVNQLFRQGFEHRYAYDFETLALQLRRGGFSEITARTFRDSAQPELCLDQELRASESLYVEAAKG